MVKGTVYFSAHSPAMSSFPFPFWENPFVARRETQISMERRLRIYSNKKKPRWVHRGWFQNLVYLFFFGSGSYHPFFLYSSLLAGQATKVKDFGTAHLTVLIDIDFINIG
jgi:hypothetical protein